MRVLSVTEVARNFSSVLDQLQRDQEEIVLVRNHRQIARLVPEPPTKDALAVLGDLHRTLDDDTADALAASVAEIRKGKRGRLSELRNPWDS
jgi:antitoxin (DNA-binding transcriptional repressor) of toxin-antitoxin stability system